MTIVVDTFLTVKSPAFSSNGKIPSKYTCDGSNVNPELHISDLPKGTKSLAVIMDDPDAPSGDFTHWVMWNHPPNESIAENSSSGVLGRNENNENKYYGPCPPSGIHHYHFRVYALDTELNLPMDADKRSLLNAMDAHILGSGEVIGVYNRK